MPATNRRRFFQKAGTLSATAFFASLAEPAWGRNLEKILREFEGISPNDIATEEDFWYYIQQSFTGSPGLINLNNGGVSPAPIPVFTLPARWCCGGTRASGLTSAAGR